MTPQDGQAAERAGAAIARKLAGEHGSFGQYWYQVDRRMSALYDRRHAKTPRGGALPLLIVGLVGAGAAFVTARSSGLVFSALGALFLMTLLTIIAARQRSSYRTAREEWVERGVLEAAVEDAEIRHAAQADGGRRIPSAPPPPPPPPPPAPSLRPNGLLSTPPPPPPRPFPPQSVEIPSAAPRARAPIMAGPPRTAPTALAVAPANPQRVTAAVPTTRLGITRIFHARALVGTNGRPISSEDRDAWLRARREGVTATDCSKIVRKDGVPSKQRQALLDRKLTGDEGPRLAVYDHGIEREPVIAAWVRDRYGIEPNSHLCVGEHLRHLATPDGLGDGVVAEIKTSVLPLAKILSRYSDQLQWQLHVTDSDRLLFVVEDRHMRSPGPPEVRWIPRDEHRISVLTTHANLFLEELDERRARRFAFERGH